jgi:hypothetical protein
MFEGLQPLEELAAIPRPVIGEVIFLIAIVVIRQRRWLDGVALVTRLHFEERRVRPRHASPLE